MIKLINESSLFQYSFLINYFNGNIFFITHIYVIPFGYCKSQTKSNHFRLINYISKYSHQKFRTQMLNLLRILQDAGTALHMHLSTNLPIKF